LTLLPGWTKDTGEKFGDRGNGMEYGWNYDVSDPHVLSGVDPTCTSYAESNKIQNSTYVPDWTLNEQCTNCDRIKSTLNYQEHVLLEPSNINGNSTTCDLLNSNQCLESTVCDMIEDKCESVTIGNNLSTNIIIGVAVGGGLLFILGGIVIFIVVMKKIKYGSNNNSRSKRKGTIELIEETETEDEKAYCLSRKLEKKQSRATDFYGSNHDLITVNANLLTHKPVKVYGKHRKVL
jgi:hypothetical protein